MATLVLVVTGDPVLGERIVVTLRSGGYDVRAAATGAEGLAAIDAGTVPDVIYLTAKLPDMDSWEFVKRYRKRGDAAARIITHLKGPVDGRALLNQVARHLAAREEPFAEREGAAAGGTCAASGAPAAIHVAPHRTEWEGAVIWEGVQLGVQVRGERPVHVNLQPDDCAALIAALQQASRDVA